MLNLFNISQEAINFQDKSFGKEIEEHYQDIRNTCKTTEDYIKSEKSSVLSKIIKKHTAMSISIAVTEFNGYGPAIYLPTLHNNHIFTQDYIKPYLNKGPSEAFINSLKKRKLESGVDLVKGKVFGVFEDIEATMLMSVETILDARSTVAEIAGVTLHEVGHLFTYFEYFDRTITTNQILMNMSENMADTNDNKVRHDIVLKACEAIGVDYKTINGLDIEADARKAAIVLMRASFSSSVFSNAKYDQTNQEALADQYAARCGYAKEVAMYLDRYNLYKNASFRIVMFISQLWRIFIIIAGLAAVAIASVPIFLLMMGIIALSIVSMGHYSNVVDYTYDSNPTRIKRLREQLVVLLKQKTLPTEIINNAIQDIKVFDDILKFTIDQDKVALIISDFFNANGNSPRATILLQRRLEELASSDLYLAAAKLKSIS